MLRRTIDIVWLTDSLNTSRIPVECKKSHSISASSLPVWAFTSNANLNLFLLSVLTSRLILTLGAQMEMWNMYMWRYSVRNGERLWHILYGHHRIRLWNKMDVMIIKRSLNNRVMRIFPKIMGIPIDATQISSIAICIFNLQSCRIIFHSIWHISGAFVFYFSDIKSMCSIVFFLKELRLLSQIYSMALARYSNAGMSTYTEYFVHG